MKDFLAAQFIGEQEINLLYQQRAREQIKLNKLRLQGLHDEKKLLEEQQADLKTKFNETLAELQKETFKNLGSVTLPGIFGQLSGQMFSGQSLLGKTFDEIEELFVKGQLEGRAKDLFLELQKIKQAGIDVDKLLEENKQAVMETFTATTRDSIADNIIEGFKEGKRGAADFADDFQTLMQNAVLNSLKFKYLEGPLQGFFEAFAADSESGGVLTEGEIERLESMYNTILANFGEKFQNLQDIAGINLSNGAAGGTGRTLTGAIRGITAEQAELLAGQFGAQRLTLIDILNISKQGLTQLQKIENNTYKIHALYDLWRRLEINGLKAL